MKIADKITNFTIKNGNKKCAPIIMIDAHFSDLLYQIYKY